LLSHFNIEPNITEIIRRNPPLVAPHFLIFTDLGGLPH